MNQSESTIRVPGKYLTVLIQQESFGIAVTKVREIIRLQKITPVPQLPAHVKGVINLRDRVVPVIDLRLKFGAAVKYAERTCIVVVLVYVPDASILNIGLIVDGVGEVVEVGADQIEAVPTWGAHLSAGGILGLARIKGEVNTLLDIDRIVTDDALETLVRNVRD